MYYKIIKLHNYLQRNLSVCFLLILILSLYGVLKLKRTTMKKNDMVHKSITRNITTLPILVMACDRTSVRRCLHTLIKYRPVKETLPIIVSQDCGHEPTYQIIKSFVDRDPTITVVRQPNQSDIPLSREEAHLKGYYRIARHYKFALNHVFRTLQYKAVVVVEDDLLISSDFFEYFLATSYLLYEDPTIWCVSAWNDNCKKDLVELSEVSLLHRTNFFPGLGWMIQSETWEELEPHWPQAYFDDWLRDPTVSGGRVCIRPEISRTYHMGTYGVSKGQFYDKDMHFHKGFVQFRKMDISYVLFKYEPQFVSFVYSLPETTATDVVLGKVNSSWEYVRIPYTDTATFKLSAKLLGLMDDLRYGVPRTGLHGIVQCFFKGRRVFLARAPKGKRSTTALRLSSLWQQTSTRTRKKEETINQYEESLEI